MKKVIFTVTSLILCVMFACLMLFIMLEGIHILDSKNGTRALIFTGIDVFMLLSLIGFGKPISRYIGVSMYIPICVATVIYMFFAFGTTFGLAFVLPNVLFTTVKLVILFIFFCVTIPLAVVGATSRNGDVNKEVKKHDI